MKVLAISNSSKVIHLFTRVFIFSWKEKNNKTIILFAPNSLLSMLVMFLLCNETVFDCKFKTQLITLEVIYFAIFLLYCFDFLQNIWFVFLIMLNSSHKFLKFLLHHLCLFHFFSWILFNVLTFGTLKKIWFNSSTVFLLKMKVNLKK